MRQSNLASAGRKTHCHAHLGRVKSRPDSHHRYPPHHSHSLSLRLLFASPDRLHGGPACSALVAIDCRVRNESKGKAPVHYRARSMLVGQVDTVRHMPSLQMSRDQTKVQLDDDHPA